MEKVQQLKPAHLSGVLRVLVSGLSMGLALSLILSQVQAAGETENDAANKAPTTKNNEARLQQSLGVAQLEGEEPLGKQVSLEAKRRPLRDAIADFAGQSGVKLECGDTVPASLLVTLRVHESPLWSVMSSLSRVYGTTWSKTPGGGYRMNKESADPLQDKIRQVGHPMMYRFNEGSTAGKEIERQARRELAAEVMQSVDFNALRSPQGVALSDLPPDLVQRIRAFHEDNYAKEIVKTYFAMTPPPLPPDTRVKIFLPAFVVPAPNIHLPPQPTIAPYINVYAATDVVFFSVTLPMKRPVYKQVAQGPDK